MATRSPGIYYNEIDNTQFENPKSVSGTTLAILGYAKKGKVGVPTEITSWNKFIDTFGDPVEGMYSGLAVKNFLGAGGTVLFTRVADETLTSPSNYVVKNGKPRVDGYAYFEKTGDILKGDEKYVQESIYNFKATVGENTKYFLIRSPKEGKMLSLTNVSQQINDQLNETPAIFETKIEDFKTNLYGFNINVNGEPISENDFYIETSDSDSSKELFVENLKSALKQTNAITVMEVIGTPSQESAIDPEFDYSKTLKDTPKSFTVGYGNKGETKKISMDFSSMSGAIKISDIAKELDKQMKEIFNIRVFAVSGELSSGRNDKLVFVDLNLVNGSTIGISTIAKGSIQEGDLFAGQAESDIGPNFPAAELEDTKHIFVKVYNTTACSIADISKIEDGIEYDKVTEDLIIKTSTLGETASIKFVETKFVAEGAKTLSLFDEGYGVFGGNFFIDGQKKIDLKVEKDLDLNKIVFRNADEKPILASVSSLSGDTYFDNDNDYGIKDFIEVVGIGESHESTPAIDPESRDQVVFTSKEKGSGTNNIAVEVFTTVNPIDEKDIKRTLVVYSGAKNAPVETYQNISLKTDDPKRFDKVINAPVDEGGSSYIKITVVKKKSLGEEGTEVELPDGIWNLGKPNKEGDRKKEEGTAITNYNNYEYLEGNDGIPEEEGYLLFEKAMDPIESPLANKDLYDFHILITPDVHESQEAQAACMKLCETRGDALTIVDPPVGLSKKDVIDWHNGKGGFGRTVALDSNYAVTYWPWCKVFDTTAKGGRFAWVMPSIIMAAQYVKVDRAEGPQMAPAGEKNGSLPVIDIQTCPSPTDRDELYTNYNRVNPICKFKDGSVVAYGEKTTQRKDSVLTKIHTRRMLIQIKKQCKEVLKPYIFLPNTTDYLGKISNNVTAVLESYKSNGGLNFYRVICDETNNPTEVRQQDMINVDVVLVPQGTIEQINISLTLNKTAETITD